MKQIANERKINCSNKFNKKVNNMKIELYTILLKLIIKKKNPQLNFTTNYIRKNNDNLNALNNLF